MKFYLLLALLVSSCATYKWVKPGANESDFNSDRYNCQMDATKSYPPVYQEQVVYDAYAGLRGKSSCSSNVNQIGNYRTIDTECNDRNYPPPTTQQVDLNTGSRGSFYSSCMNSKGWNLVKFEN